MYLGIEYDFERCWRYRNERTYRTKEKNEGLGTLTLKGWGERGHSTADWERAARSGRELSKVSFEEAKIKCFKEEGTTYN